MVRRGRLRLRRRPRRPDLPARGPRHHPEPLLPGRLRRHLRGQAPGRRHPGPARGPPGPQGGPRLHPHDDGGGDLRHRRPAPGHRARRVGARPAHLPQAHPGLLHRRGVRRGDHLYHRVRPEQEARLRRGKSADKKKRSF